MFFIFFFLFCVFLFFFFFFFSSRRRHTRLQGDWSSDVCSSDLPSTSCVPALSSFTPASSSLRGMSSQYESLVQRCIAALASPSSFFSPNFTVTVFPFQVTVSVPARRSQSCLAEMTVLPSLSMTFQVKPMRATLPQLAPPLASTICLASFIAASSPVAAISTTHRQPSIICLIACTFLKPTAAEVMPQVTANPPNPE